MNCREESQYGGTQRLETCTKNVGISIKRSERSAPLSRTFSSRIPTSVMIWAIRIRKVAYINTAAFCAIMSLVTVVFMVIKGITSRFQVC